MKNAKISYFGVWYTSSAVACGRTCIRIYVDPKDDAIQETDGFKDNLTPLWSTATSTVRIGMMLGILVNIKRATNPCFVEPLTATHQIEHILRNIYAQPNTNNTTI